MKWRELLQKTLIHFFLIMTTKFTILGSGSSLGIPRIDGYFGKCNSKIKRNYRSRCSALIKDDNLNILIDTSPDLKSQLLKNKIKNIDKVFYTHMHGDQTHGINELRVFYLKNKKKLDIFADKPTSKYLISSVSVWLVNFNFKCFNFRSAISFPTTAIFFLSSFNADLIFDFDLDVITNRNQSFLGFCFLDVIIST